LQDLWAEVSEKMADVVDPAVKYGGGPEGIRKFLAEFSDIVSEREELELMPLGPDPQRLERVRERFRLLFGKELAE
jgi:hypothetical protein